MINEPGKIALTGMFIGAVAIAVGLSQFDRSWLSTAELGLERDNGEAHPTRSDTITGPVTTDPVAVPHDSTAVAGQLYAVPNSLQSNDVATAQPQPEATGIAHPSEDQVPALQGNEQATVAQTPPAPASAQANRATLRGPKSARTSSVSAGNTGRAYGPHATPRTTSTPSYAYAKNRRGSESTVAASSAVSTSGAKVGEAGEPVFVGPLDSAPVEVKRPAQPDSALPSSSPSELTAHASPTSSPMESQSGASGGTQLKPGGGPKTRAQVRAEIAQARADGSLPAFGNPDPAGPGGAPNLTLLPRP